MKLIETGSPEKAGCKFAVKGHFIFSSQVEGGSDHLSFSADLSLIVEFSQINQVIAQLFELLVKIVRLIRIIIIRINIFEPIEFIRLIQRLADDQILPRNKAQVGQRTR